MKRKIAFGDSCGHNDHPHDDNYNVISLAQVSTIDESVKD